MAYEENDGFIPLPLNLWDVWINDPSIFEYALQHYPEVVDKQIRKEPTSFHNFKLIHPHVIYSERLQQKRLDAWDSIPCGTVLSTQGRNTEWLSRRD